MQIHSDEVHIWSANLAIDDEEASQQALMLSADESQRADRFRFPIHRKRFIAARFALRTLLGKYLNCSPDKIIFAYNEHHKPSLYHPTALNLHFNVSHSHDLAVYALRLNYVLGIDIEKYADDFKSGFVERYFSQAEIGAFNRLATAQKPRAFYQLWTKKEAFIKAVGKGLAIPLASFSVALDEHPEKIFFENKIWYLTSLNNFPDYAAALVSDENYQIRFFKFSDIYPK